MIHKTLKVQLYFLTASLTIKKCLNDVDIISKRLFNIKKKTLFQIIQTIFLIISKLISKNM